MSVRVNLSRQTVEVLERLAEMGFHGGTVPEVVRRLVEAELDRRSRGIVMPTGPGVSTGARGKAQGGMAGVEMRRADEVEMVDEHTVRGIFGYDAPPEAFDGRPARVTQRTSVTAGSAPRVAETKEERLALLRKVAATGTLRTADQLEAEQAPWGVKEEE